MPAGVVKQKRSEKNTHPIRLRFIFGTLQSLCDIFFYQHVHRTKLITQGATLGTESLPLGKNVGGNVTKDLIVLCGLTEKVTKCVIPRMKEQSRETTNSVVIYQV